MEFFGYYSEFIIYYIIQSILYPRFHCSNVLIDYSYSYSPERLSTMPLLLLLSIFSCCYLVSGAADGSVKVWEFSTCNLLHSLSSATDSTDAISSISIGSNGRVIVSKTQRFGYTKHMCSYTYASQSCMPDRA